jgi:hypothetical protein
VFACPLCAKTYKSEAGLKYHAKIQACLPVVPRRPGLMVQESERAAGRNPKADAIEQEQPMEPPKFLAGKLLRARRKSAVEVGAESPTARCADVY